MRGAAPAMVRRMQLRSYFDTSFLMSMTTIGGTTNRIETRNLEMASRNPGKVNLGRMTSGVSR